MSFQVVRGIGLLVAVCAGFAVLLALALQQIRAGQASAPTTVLTFGLALPEAITAPVKESYTGHGLTVEAPGAPRFLCAQFQGQRQAYTILDNASIELAQGRMAAFPFGVATNRFSIVRPQTEPELAPGSTRKALPTLVYTRNALGLGTGGLIIWLEGAHGLFVDAALTFAVLLPMLFIFSGACILTRVVLDGEPGTLRLMLMTSSIFLVYVLVLLFVLRVPTMDELGGRYLDAWKSAVIRDLFGFCACAAGFAIWRNWRRQLMPRIGIFATSCIALNTVVTVLVVALLVSAGKMGLRGWQDVTGYAVEAYVAEFKRLAGEPLPEWLTSLPTWQETCPPWTRHVAPQN